MIFGLEVVACTESCQSWTKWLIYEDTALACVAFDYKALGDNGT